MVKPYQELYQLIRYNFDHITVEDRPLSLVIESAERALENGEVVKAKNLFHVVLELPTTRKRIWHAHAYWRSGELQLRHNNLARANELLCKALSVNPLHVHSLKSLRRISPSFNPYSEIGLSVSFIETLLELGYGDFADLFFEDRHHQARNVLELGCGDGFHAVIMRLLGISSYTGIELSLES